MLAEEGNERFPAHTAVLSDVSVAEFDVFFCLLNTAERWPSLITQVHDVLSSPQIMYCVLAVLCWSQFSLAGAGGSTSASLPTQLGTSQALLSW